MPRHEIFSDAELREKNINALKRRLRSRLSGYRIVLKDVPAGTLVYRGVPWLDRPRTIDQLSYPPAEKAKLNRANRPARPMFYASIAAPAVFFELRAKRGDLIALSEWEIVEPLWMHNLGYERGALAKLGAPDADSRAKVFEVIPNETPHNVNLRRMLSLAFTEDVQQGREFRYKQTIAINELLFEKAEPIRSPPGGPRSTRVAGIVYPALQMRGAADNLVLWPDFVESSMRVKSVRYVLVEHADETNSSYTFLTKALATAFSSRDIVWQESLPPEHERRSQISLERDEWILRDGLGQAYDRHAAH
jgi:hypothetical protein